MVRTMGSGGRQRANGANLHTPSRMMALALKPRFAESILSGAKTVEVRRVAPKIEMPAKALLYASTPTQAIIGCCDIIGSDVQSDIDKLWASHGPCMGLPRSEFDAYLAGAASGTALSLARPARFGAPVGLRQMREMGLRPPQSYSFIAGDLGHQIIKLGDL